MELELVEVFDLLCPRLLALDDCLSCGIARDETFVDGVQDCAFQLVVKIHGRLPLVMLGVTIDELLVRGSVQVLDFEVRDKLGEPRLSESIFPHRDLADGSLLIDTDPLRVVIAKEGVFGDGDEHYLPPSSCVVAHADEG